MGAKARWWMDLRGWGEPSVLGFKKRVKHVAEIMGMDLKTALEYCDSVEI